MYKKNYTDYVEDMLQACIEVEIVIKNINYDEFKIDKLRLRAIERLFEIIGEAANRIPKELQLKYTEIPWKNIIGMRNIIIHTYESVDSLTLWEAAKQDLPVLTKELKNMLKNMNKDF